MMESGTLFNENSGVFYMAHTGPFNTDSPNSSMHVGLLAMEIGPEMNSEPLFHHIWAAPQDNPYLPTMTLSRDGVLIFAASPTDNFPGPALTGMNARTGQQYWDRGLALGSAILPATPESAFTVLTGAPRSDELTYADYDFCGAKLEQHNHHAVPLGDYRVEYDTSGSSNRIRVRNASEEILLETSCRNPPVAVDFQTLACRDARPLKILDLQARAVTEIPLPLVDEESERDQIFSQQIIALRGRKVLLAAALRNAHEGFNRFFVFDISSETLTRQFTIIDIDFEFGIRTAFSHRGVLYSEFAARPGELQVAAIQTGQRPARTPWPLGYPATRSSIAGNDGRGWVDVGPE